MPRLSDQFLEELKNRIDIEQLIGDYVDLKRAGNLVKGLCPFHNEKTPSFVVYPDSQSFYCYGCAKGGDAITFVRDIENITYMEAVKLLADRAGLNMPNEEYDDTIAKKRKRMLEMNKEAARFFYNYMISPEGAVGLDYWMNKRGLTPETIKHFGLGYAPDDWNTFVNYMHSLKYSSQELLEADLLRKGQNGYYPIFKNRVVTPIIDLRGNIVAFGGRVLDDSKPKYVNTSDTLIYKKGQNLFALNFAKSSGEDSLVLCEGYMDVIALHQAGFTNTVAGLGTAFTDEQVRLLSHYCSKVYLSYDSDEAGQKALHKAIEKLSKTNLNIHPLKYNDGKDPDEIIKKFGPERWKAILSGAMNEIEYSLLSCKEGLDLTTDDGKVAYLKSAVPVLAKLGTIEQDIYISRISEEVNVNKEAIKERVKAEESRLFRQQHLKTDFGSLQKSIDGHLGKTSVRSNVGLRGVMAEETIIASLTRNPDFLKTVDANLKPEDFTNDFLRHVYVVYKERISAGQPIDFIHISGEFDSDEMGQLSRLLNGDMVLSNTIAEINDCIKVIKEEKLKLMQSETDPATLSNEEFLKLFNKRGE